MQPTPSFMSRLLSHLTYSKKFLIIGLLFVTSLAVSIFFMIAAQNRAISYAQSELKGSQYIRVIRKLLETIPEHQVLAYRFLKENPSIQNELQNAQNVVNADFKNLLSADSELQFALRTTVDDLQAREISTLRPSELEKRWLEASTKLSDASPEANLAQHQKLLKDLTALLKYIEESSGQNADQDIITYYLLNTALNPIPKASSIVSLIMLRSEELAKNPDESSFPRHEIIGQITRLKAQNQAITDTLDKLYALGRNSAIDPEIFTKLRDPYKQYQDVADEFIGLIEKQITSEKPSSAEATEVSVLGSKVNNALFTLWDSIYEQADRLILQRVEYLKKQLWIWTAICLGAAFIGLSLGYVVLQEITGPLITLVNAAKQLAGGDLSVRVPIRVHDEVAQVSEAFNLIAESFQELIGRLQWTGIQLTTSTTEIAAAAKQQEATVVEQEATTKEIAVTAKEISSTAKAFAKTMNEVSSTAEQTSALASSGKVGLNRMESIMHQMVEASSNIAAKLGILSDKAGNITNVITTINKIAEQTNLLSLNAAIEAEKAGEHGRSFAVIAREIRRLADQTANATSDIEKMVNEIVSAVSAGVMGVDKFSEEINTGVGQVSVVSELLTKIIEQVQLLTTSFENVNQGMQGQSLSADEIDDSITELSDSAQQTTESIRQFHNAIEQLNNAAIEMQNAVSKIKR